MNLNNMRYFTSVVHHGGISKAAAREHVTQQTMSAHIAALEKELGCQLLIRRPAFALTDEGHRFLQYCERFLQLEDAMGREFADMQEDVGGVLRVATATTRGRVLMPDMIMEFRREFPRTCVIMEEGQNDALFQWLAEGKVDVAVGRVPGENAAYESRKLYDERMMLAVPRVFLDPQKEERLLRTKDLGILRNDPFILSYENDIAGSFGRLLISHAGIVGNIAAEADNAASLLAMVANGVGSCFCPDSLIPVCATQDQLERMLLVPLDVTYSIGVAWRSTAYLDRKASRFIDIVTRACAGRSCKA